MADAMDVDAPPQPPTVVAGAPVPEAPPAPASEKAEAGENASPPARGSRSTAQRR